jgi:SOS-response transcriptional repressor LexA
MATTTRANRGHDGLTAIQREVMAFVGAACDAGISPSFREIRDAFGFRSPNAVMNHVKALGRKGWLARPRREECRAMTPILRPSGDGETAAVVIEGERIEGRLARDAGPSGHWILTPTRRGRGA